MAAATCTCVSLGQEPQPARERRPSVVACAMSRLSTMAAAMSFDEMRDSLASTPPFGGAPLCGDGVVEITRVDGDWDEASYARAAGLRDAPRSSSSRDSSTFGDGSDYEELLRLDEDNVKRGLSANAIRRLRRRSVSAREKIEDPITRGQTWVIDLNFSLES